MLMSNVCQATAFELSRLREMTRSRDDLLWVSSIASSWHQGSLCINWDETEMSFTQTVAQLWRATALKLLLICMMLWDVWAFRVCHQRSWYLTMWWEDKKQRTTDTVTTRAPSNSEVCESMLLRHGGMDYGGNVNEDFNYNDWFNWLSHFLNILKKQAFYTVHTISEDTVSDS